MMQHCQQISEYSTSLMGFLVDDLLDYAQMQNGKFRQVIKEFDLREAIEEVVLIQAD